MSERIKPRRLETPESVDLETLLAVVAHLAELPNVPQSLDELFEQLPPLTDQEREEFHLTPERVAAIVERRRGISKTRLDNR